MNRSNPGRDDRSITRAPDVLQPNPTDAPPGGQADWLAGRLHNAITILARALRDITGHPAT
jgi:GntR family transcriptional regulator/MocR family aminotransferase